MAENIFDLLLEGARDALRLYVALFRAPISVLSAFVRRTGMWESSGRGTRTH
jgi:hypothetical protein